MRIVFYGPKTSAALKDKRAAFKSLTGHDPVVTVKGSIERHGKDGDIAFLDREYRVEGIGLHRITLPVNSYQAVHNQAYRPETLDADGYFAFQCPSTCDEH